ncbi:MAG: hypothetical protein QOF89_3872 [Acidobacteriota bacterium]|jgi:hypothetical protein|nr:hypothetical protein [Acidobacteriota bacterium]
MENRGLIPDSQAAGQESEAGSRPPGRPYERPRILSREPLEAVAAVCSPAGVAKSNPGLCPSGPISS